MAHRHQYQILALAAALAAAACDPPATVSTPMPPRTEQSLERLLAREFTDQDGRTVRVSDARGKAVVLSFLYTRCPVPTMCPLVTEKLVEFQGRLPDDLRDRVVLLTVTLDPAYDTPAVLKEYAARYGADTTRWHFVTAKAEEIRESTDCCGVAFREESPGVVAHTMNTMVIAPDGSVAEEHSGSGWTVDALVQSVQRALQEGRP